MSEHAPHTSILMPAYNLESTIGSNIARVASVVAEWTHCEIIVIDDGSTDGTRDSAESAAAATETATVIGYDQNRGKGGALKEGFRRARGDTIVFLDADLDLPPEQLPDFLTVFDRLGVDALVGAKRSVMTRDRYPTLRRILSVTFRSINRVLFRLPIHETQTGLKVFRRKALESTLLELSTEGYAFDLELMVRIQKAGGSMAEAPVILSVGSAGDLSISVLAQMGADTLRIWFRSLTWSRQRRTH